MTERPWSTQPITGAQHDAWMAAARAQMHRIPYPFGTLLPTPRLGLSAKATAVMDAFMAHRFPGEERT